MNYQILLVAVCLRVGMTLSKSTLNPCQQSDDGICGKGQHVMFSDDEISHRCVDCPQGTFMDFDRHGCETCKRHTQPNSGEVVIMQGSSSTDNIVGCNQGFFRIGRASLEFKGGCEKCSVCGDRMWEARECGDEEDTLCCSTGMVPMKDGDSLVCILPEPEASDMTNAVRKERSSGSNEHNVTDDDENTNNASNKKNSGEQIHEGNSHSNPDHGYSRADYETEYPHNQVEFPIWARILCAGVAIGVFLFYLGVGIPCNACGSRDKLRALRNWMFHRHDPVPTEEESKEKQTEKEKPGIDQV